MIFVGLAAYVSIFLSLKNLQREFHVREENQKMQAEREYLQLATGNMARRLELMEEVSAQNVRAAHDRRHFNNVLLELLERGEAGEATALLQGQNQTTHKISKVYCENLAVNAAVCHYASLAEQAGIRLEITLDIPVELAVDSLELSMAVSNLMENAVQACGRLPQDRPLTPASLAGAWVGCFWKWKIPATGMPHSTKTATPSPGKKVTVSAAGASSPLRRNMTAS